MRFIKLLIAFIFLFSLNEAYSQCNNSLIDSCKSKLGERVYLKHFKLRFNQTKKRGNPSIANFSLYLNKGINYTFTIANDKTLKGEAVVKLYDDFRFYGSNEIKKGNKLAEAFGFNCTKTGIYFITIEYKDGEEGCSVIMLSMEKKS